MEVPTMAKYFRDKLTDSSICLNNQCCVIKPLVSLLRLIIDQKSVDLIGSYWKIALRKMRSRKMKICND